jgi:hypothetical protein
MILLKNPEDGNKDVLLLLQYDSYSYSISPVWDDSVECWVFRNVKYVNTTLHGVPSGEHSGGTGGGPLPASCRPPSH